jgi:subtilisin family serine protease
MKNSLLFILCWFSLFINIYAQEKETVINLQLNTYLDTTEPSTITHLLIEANSSDFEEVARQNNAIIKVNKGRYYSISLPAQNIRTLAKSPTIKRIDFSIDQPHLLSDTMLINNRVIRIHQGDAPFMQPYTGKGVLVGIIDSGIDYNHPDFKDSLGRTKVLALWDQNKPVGPNTPMPYGYGQEWDSAAINSNTANHDDPANQFGHGSMVSGSAISTGLATGNFKGVAPDANLIVVSSNFGSSQFLANIADATDYIYSIADSLGMPCVINASLGTYVGSHDGKDVAAQLIDQSIKAKNGRAFVAANGNAGNQKFHLGYQVTSDTNFTWFKTSPNIFNPFVYYRLYADTSDFNQVEFAFGADQVSPNYKFRGRTDFKTIHNSINTYQFDTIFSPHNGNVITEIRTYAEEVNGTYMLEVYMNRPDSLNYHYRLETTGSGHFDLWSSNSLMPYSDMVSSNLPSVSQFPDIANYKSPDSLSTMVSSFTCLPSVISVGNYQNRKTYRSVNNVIQVMPGTPGKISPNSSLGPTRLGVIKPDISASGDYTLSAGRLATIQQNIISDPAKVSADSMHMRNGGTSMASPVVAGIAALYFEKCPNASYLEINQAIINQARADNFTGIVPNFTFGFGKIDGYEALANSIQKPTINPITLQNLCQGDSVLLIPFPSNYTGYSWSNGDSASFTYAKNNGDFFALVENSKGCKALTDTLSLLFNPKPPKPFLFQNYDTLYTPQVGFYNWFKDGFRINGVIDSFYVANQDGNYWTRKINTNTGCGTNSDTIYYTSTSVLAKNHDDLKIYPNPASSRIYIENTPSQNVDIRLINHLGQTVHSFSNITNNILSINTSSLVGGVYFLQLKSRNTFINKKIIITND